MEMVTIRLFIFVLVLISLQASHLAAELHQGMGVRTATMGKEIEETQSILVAVNKINFDEVPARIAVDAKLFGGRKMKMERVLIKEETSKDDEEAPRLEASKISGAARSVGSCEGTPNGKCEFTKRRTRPVEGKTTGFTAFSADYNLPKSHDPKNN